MKVNVTVNGQAREGDPEPRKTLADFLREDLGLTGTHLGCEHGGAGACTAVLGGEVARGGRMPAGEPVRACVMLAVQANGGTVRTIEGLNGGAEGTLSPLRQAMQDSHGFQC